MTDFWKNKKYNESEVRNYARGRFSRKYEDHDIRDRKTALQNIIRVDLQTSIYSTTESAETALKFRATFSKKQLSHKSEKVKRR